MNALQHALGMIKQQIPYEVIHAAFTIDENPVTVNITSIDDKVMLKCIRPRVMTDANIMGGVETVIPLNTIPPSFFEDFYTVYYIPPEQVMNREIISVIGLSSLPLMSTSGSQAMMGSAYGIPNGISADRGYGGNSLMAVADRIGDAAAINGVLHNAHLELVAYNTVAVYAHFRTLAYLGLRVLLANDNNMNNIQPRSYRQFSTLCTLAVKAYIYNKLVIAINNGLLSGGQDLGMFKSIIDNYAQAEEDYQNYLVNVWAKVAFMNDTQRHARFITGLIAPDL